MGLSHRGAHRGRHGVAERTSCAKRAQNARTTCVRAVRCCSVCGSVCGCSFGWFGSVRLGARFGWRWLSRCVRFGVRLLLRLVRFGSVRCSVRVAVTSSVVAVRCSVRCGSVCGWRMRPLPPSVAPSVAGAQPSHPLTLAPSHPLARPRTPSLAPCAFTAAVARRRVSLPLPSVGRCAAPRSLVGRLYLPLATALFPGAPAARLRPACFTARLGRAVALGN